ncbi:DUF3025 domain-containing protein [Dyella caseinilytica]|uniref:DUF3025 domain-containing protein n=1 Tax=Dyella caseinilytica TaxID=1849581 RepID=A0ABX7GPD6_9GAMM|nr:DUF3025 domain-containing protein [Dyella caseinilytica]QRN52184.1 DUF3025 domain-containing protein [Dyella caseinilytica]GGA13955.1 hypothetical protein GCM10011408_39400 [Dyella caseinilytica]
MRYVAPARENVDAAVFGYAPLCEWLEYGEWLYGSGWPSIDDLNARWSQGANERFVAQTRELLEDGLHYEERIAERSLIATREENWHDLFNAMIWLRYPSLKRALNRQQVADIVRLGPRQRSRPQCAQTHFDEAGVIAVLRDPDLIDLWNAHDWYGLFWRHRSAWNDGLISVEVFGHALLEHALAPGKLLVGKALAVHAPGKACRQEIIEQCAEAISAGRLLRDPQELRPLPLSGIPGWHPGSDSEAFHLTAECYQPLREGRYYPTLLPIT